MRVAVKSSAFMVLAALWAVQAHAQTADEVVEKYLAAIGGRAALAKLQTRIATGGIAVSVQDAQLAGPIEIYNKAPNKARTFFKLDLSQMGAAEMVVDQRCDGKTAFETNSLQGDREISGNQLQNMLNATFPTPLLSYKEAGTKIEFTGKDRVGTRDVYVLRTTPKAGPSLRQFFDAETGMQLRMITTVEGPGLGGEIEQTTDFSDYRAVDGIKVAFALVIVNAAQTVTITLNKVEHNQPIEDAMFARPAVK
jgi:outer membrane lipoprotein-sorting protein